ncbi:TPA: restriction endonuclease subunit S [Photobacterium damselae]
MSWPKEKLSKVATIIRGVTFSKADGIEHAEEGRVPVIRAGSIQKRLLINSGQIWVPKEKVKDHQYIKQNDILMCTSSGSADLVGKCAKSDADYFVSFGAFCAGIRPDLTKISPSYLYHFLCSPKFKNWTKNSSGANIKNIRASELADFEIPLPPLKEQQRIAAILDKADAIRQKRKQAIELADEFLRSVFLDMFGDPVTNPKGWDEVILKNIADIRSGVTKGKKIPLDQSVTLPYMRVANVQDGYLDLSTIQEITVSKKDAEKCKLNTGDILLTEGGDIDKLGRGHVWNDEIENCIHQNHIFSVRVKNIDYVRPEFLSALIASQRGKRYFLKVGKQTTGIATINKTVLSDFSPFIPDIVLQDKYLETAKLVRNLYNNIDSNDTVLFNSLSQKAFSGQL